ncbi:hypothetical protein LguiA_022354 [Lonicera macranthoides]
MFDNIPLEVLTDIFLRLPIKSLLRCTSVCKSWYSFLTSPSFITSHLNLSISINNQTSRLLVRVCTDDDDDRTEDNNFRLCPNFRFSTTRRERFSVHIDDDQTFKECAILDFPFTSRQGYFRIIGILNGLVCLSDDEGVYMDIIILWNPSLKKTLTLPKPRVISKSHGPYRCSIGFGFAAATNDYKVVRVVYLKNDDGYDKVPPEVEIYERSTGTWRDVNAGGFNSVIKERAPQAFLNGIVHWIGFNRNKVDFTLGMRIVSFDLENETSGTLMVPNALQNEWFMWVATFGESLSLIHQKDNSCCIWTMKEYGVADSWTKLFNIQQEQKSFWRSVWFRQNGGILLVRHFRSANSDEGHLCSYDPERKQIKSLGIHGKAYAFYIDTYMESLVLIKA